MSIHHWRWACIGLTVLSGSPLYALSAPGVVASTAAWSASATLLNVSATNSSSIPNPAGTLYFFGAALQSMASVSNGQFNADGQGHIVVSNVAYPYTPSGAPTAQDVIAGQVSPLLANSTYYVYAQACPPASNPQIPRQPNDAGCSAWQLVNNNFMLTPGFQSPNFDVVHPGDVSGGSWGVIIPSVTLHTTASNADEQNIVYWHVKLVDLVLGTTAQTMNLIGSHQKQTIYWAPAPTSDPNASGALLGNRGYKISQWFEYPYQQTSSTSTGVLYTSPEPANLSFKTPPAASVLISTDNLVAVTSTTITVKYLNSVDPRLPNPVGAIMGALTYEDTDYADTLRSVQTPSVLGVSTETITLTLTNLLPGTTYGVYTHVIYPSSRTFPDAIWTYAQQLMGHVQTLGTPPAPFDDPIFVQVMPGDVQPANFQAKSKLASTESDIAAWHLTLHDVTNNTNSPELIIPASRFVVYKGSWSVVVSTADWVGLLPGNKFVPTEWLEYNDGSLSTPVLAPYFFTKPQLPGIPVNPITNATDHSLTVQIANSFDVNDPNPKGMKYYFYIYQNNQIVSSGKVSNPLGVSTQTITFTGSNLNPNTLYTVKTTLSLDNPPWPTNGPIVISTSAMTLPQDRVITIDPATVTTSSAAATLADVQDSSQAVHFTLNWGGSVESGAWTKNASAMAAPVTNLMPNQSYQVQGQVCTSADSSQCVALLPGAFTSQPATISTGAVSAQPTSVTASWQDANPMGTVYKMQVCSIANTPVCTEVIGSTKPVSNATLTQTFPNLIEGTTYQVQVEAINRGGAPWPDSLWSTVGIIRTPPSNLLAVLSARFTLNGFPLDNTTVCVPPAAQLQITFNRDLDTTTLPSGLVVQHRAFEINGVPVTFGAYQTSYASVGSSHVLTISPPASGWPSDDPINVILKSTIHDTYPTYLSGGFTFGFVAADDPTSARQISSFVNAQALSTLRFPANSSDATTCTVLRTQFIAPTNAIAADVNHIVSGSLLQGLRNSAQEIVSVRNDQRANVGFLNPVTLFIAFPPNTNLTSSGSDQALPTQWVIAYLNPQTSQLEAVTNSVVSANGVQATIQQPGVYMLAQAFSSTDVSEAYAYPVPYRSTMPISGITFANLGAGSVISVYTPSGLKVKEISVPVGESQILWNLHQGRIASGVYLYRVESPAGYKNGKLIIIQ